MITETNGSPAPQHRLADLRDWLTDRIDGGEEMRGEDGLISDFIRQIDALDDQVRSLTKPATIAEWVAANKYVEPTPASKTQSKRFAAQAQTEPRGCPTPGACSFLAENAELRNERSMLAKENLALREAKQMAEHERDGILEKLVEATNRALEVAAKVADEMTRNVAGGSNVGTAIRNLKEST